MTTTESFYIGFKYGREYGVELTPRHISEYWPDVNVDYFVQGMLDGIDNDTFRLEQSRPSLHHYPSSH